VYTLENVLKLKKDAVSGTTFLDEAMKVIRFFVSTGRFIHGNFLYYDSGAILRH
jgi:hypothetical protein